MASRGHAFVESFKFARAGAFVGAQDFVIIFWKRALAHAGCDSSFALVDLQFVAHCLLRITPSLRTIPSACHINLLRAMI